MSYGIWDVGRKKWMPDPLLGHMSRRPESFKTRGEAERTADREWRKLNPDDKFEVRPLPSTEESRRTRKPSAHKAGADYAHEQLAGSYFQDWVWEQTAEAERMRQADPNSVIDASTPAGARKVANNMLQQLEWDTKRELDMTTVGLEHGDAKAFYEGFTEQLRQTSTVEWLTDIILRTEEDMRGGRRSKLSTTQEAGRYGRRRYGDSDAVIKHKQYEEEWQRKSAEYRAKVEPLKAGLVKINGQDLRSRGLQIPSRDDEILIASLSDPRKGNEPVAHFWQYPGFGYGEDGGLGQTYFVDPAIVPTGKETREAKHEHRAQRGNAQLDTLLSGAKSTVDNRGSWSASFEDVYIWIGDTSGSRSGQYEADVNYDERSVQLQSRSYDALCRQIKKAIEELKGAAESARLATGLKESRRPVAPYYSRKR